MTAVGRQLRIFVERGGSDQFRRLAGIDLAPQRQEVDISVPGRRAIYQPVATDVRVKRSEAEPTNRLGRLGLAGGVDAAYTVALEDDVVTIPRVGVSPQPDAALSSQVPVTQHRPTLC